MFGKKEMTKGKIGEEKVKEFFLKNGFKVQDTSDDPEYRKMDIDMIVVKDGVTTTVEVKYSSTAANNYKVIVEDILNIRNGKLGWIHYCKADILIVYSHKKLFMYKPKEMLTYLDKVKEQYKTINDRINLFEDTKIDEMDQNYLAYRRNMPDPSMRNSVAVIYYVDFMKYIATGRYARIIDL